MFQKLLLVNFNDIVNLTTADSIVYGKTTILTKFKL